MAEGKNFTIQITSGTIWRTILILVLALVVYSLRDLALTLLVAVVLAAAAESPTRWLIRWSIPRVLSVLLIYLTAFGVFFVLVPFFVFPVLVGLAELVSTLPSRLGDLPSLTAASQPILWLTGKLGASISLEEIFSGFREGLIGVSGGFVQAASLFFGGFFSFVLIVIVSFYLTVQVDGVGNFLRLVTPREWEPYVLDVWRRSQRKIGFWLQGQLLLGVIVGTLVFLGLTLFRVPYALVLAVLAAAFELIPFFGPILAAVPAVILGFGESTTLGLVVIALYVIIQQFENHLIYPLVVKKIIGVPPLVVILALIIGVKLAGFLGLILAVPLATILMELASDFERQKFSGPAF